MKTLKFESAGNPVFLEGFSVKKLALKVNFGRQNSVFYLLMLRLAE